MAARDMLKYSINLMEEGGILVYFQKNVSGDISFANPA